MLQTASNRWQYGNNGIQTVKTALFYQVHLTRQIGAPRRLCNMPDSLICFLQLTTQTGESRLCQRGQLSQQHMGTSWAELHMSWPGMDVAVQRSILLHPCATSGWPSWQARSSAHIAALLVNTTLKTVGRGRRKTQSTGCE